MKRVIYEINPLIEVILQLRFPTNLSISNTEPIEFQRGISTLFPNYQPEIQNEQEISFIPNDTELKPSFRNRNTVNHSFITKEGFSKITLTNSTISISTLKYTKWEDFFSLFSEVVQCFNDVYKPQYFERIGLRYIDAFRKEQLELTDTPWNELINKPWIGVLSDIDEEKTLLSTTDTEYLLDDSNTHLKVHSGIGRINNYPNPVFIIDSDFIHIANENIEEWKKIAETLHNFSDDFYQRTITEKLKKSLKPTNLED